MTLRARRVLATVRLSQGRNLLGKRTRNDGPLGRPESTSGLTHEDEGITRNQSCRYQKLADIDDAVIDEYVQECNAEAVAATF